MESVSMAITPRSMKYAYSKDEWFCYTSKACIEVEYHNGNGDSDSELNAYKEGDDDDDGGYDYAPAA
ncbi:unnamed protein product [Lathyrus sativus]|nr:unnamed protein product [Lathyrus sativus]